MSDQSIPASSTFRAFLEPSINRCAFIEAWLRARDIPHTAVDLAGKRHIVVRFDPASYDPRFRMKTLVAHYDRMPGSPGANDNSAACFQLMLLAERLHSGTEGMPGGPVHNVRIFFTDGEEAAGTKGLAGQGSYGLGSGMRKLNLTDDDVLVFDACGRGDTLVLSTAGMRQGGTVGRRLAELDARTAALARNVAPEKWMRLPTPYSDNAGFLASGIASQVITVLPASEAGRLLGSLEGGGGRLPEELERAIVSHRYEKLPEELAEAVPETWRVMHSPADSASSLTAEAFRLTGRFLAAVACNLEPAT